MTAAIAAIAVAAIGGPLMWLLHRLDRNNTAQHGQSIEVLTRLDSKVDRLDSKLDRLDTQLDTHLKDPRRHR
jgi:hypothetical protein